MKLNEIKKIEAKCSVLSKNDDVTKILNDLEEVIELAKTKKIILGACVPFPDESSSEEEEKQDRSFLDRVISSIILIEKRIPDLNQNQKDKLTSLKKYVNNAIKTGSFIGKEILMN
ncbi:hypothetical protein [Wolbachia endosymbiont of Pentidionis agamae]|uniref:hypothetical protein n=1 Tax=Wolbachia endosymbiont of Pentidionis agamae TaxID=3110435 RepID=UPI002FD56E69